MALSDDMVKKEMDMRVDAEAIKTKAKKVMERAEARAQRNMMGKGS